MKSRLEVQRAQRAREFIELDSKIVNNDQQKPIEMIQLIYEYLNSKDYIRSQYVRRKVLKIPEGKLKPLSYNF